MLDDQAQKIFVKAHQAVLRELSRQISRVQRRIEEGRVRIEECLNWQQIHHLGELLQANLYAIKTGVTNLIVADWEQEGKEVTIPLPYGKAPHVLVADYFKKAKKLKRGIPHAERQTAITEKELLRLLSIKEALENIASLDELEEFAPRHGLLSATKSPPKVYSKPIPSKPYHCFHSASGREVWVGKSARENDKLTFQYARGNDWWMHAKDYPGSHVVIPAKKEEELDEDTMADAAELALRYSKARGQKNGEVSLTQVKWIRSVDGVPGRVMLSKHKTVRLKLDEERWNRLRNGPKTSIG